MIKYESEYYGIICMDIDAIKHHGILGQRWGKKNGPPYPLGADDHSALERKLKKSRSSSNNNKKPKKASQRKQEDQRKSKGSKLKTDGGILQALKKADALNDRAHREHNRIIAKAHATGKSAAEIEQMRKKKHSSDADKEKLKSALKIGTAAAATVLAYYGIYKLSNRTDATSQPLPGIEDVPPGMTWWDYMLSKANVESNSPANTLSGNYEFLSSAFSGKSYMAMDTTTSSKKAIDSMFIEETGDWWNGLSNSEKHGIEFYSGNNYDKMNNALWAAKGGEIQAPEHIKSAIEQAQNALDKASYPTNMVCTQGLQTKYACSFLKCTPEELMDAALGGKSADKLLGKVNTNYGLMSTTTAASYDAGFYGGVKYKILVPKGAKAAYIEHISKFGDLPHPPSWDGKRRGGPPYSSEFETLIKAGSNFKTSAIQYNTQGNFIEVALEYLLDD